MCSNCMRQALHNQQPSSPERTTDTTSPGSSASPASLPHRPLRYTFRGCAGNAIDGQMKNRIKWHEVFCSCAGHQRAAADVGLVAGRLQALPAAQCLASQQHARQ